MPDEATPGHPAAPDGDPGREDQTATPPPPPPQNSPSSKPPPQPGPVTPDGQDRGDSLIGLRAIARTLDFIFLSIVNFIAWFAFALMSIPLVDFDAGLGLFLFMAAAFMAVLNMGYFVGFELASGRSLGKIVTGLEVRRDDGSSVDFQASFVRNLFVGVCVFAFSVFSPLGILLAIASVIAIAVSMSSNKHEQGLHDQVAKTIVRRRQRPATA